MKEKCDNSKCLHLQEKNLIRVDTQAAAAAAADSALRCVVEAQALLN